MTQTNLGAALRRLGEREDGTERLMGAAAAYRAALEEGVYFHSAWHHGLCAMHTQADLEQALSGIEAAARRVARGDS